MLVAVLGVGLIGMQSAITRRHAQGVDLKRALYAAEAGVAESFAALTLGRSGEVGSPEQPARFGRALYFVEAAPAPDGDVRLRSTGLAGSARFSVEAVVRPGVDPAATDGVHGPHGLTIDEGLVSNDLGSAVPCELVSWKITELPDVPLVTSRIDPFVQLKLAGVAPLDPTHAHRETIASVDYVDPSGAARSYVGVLTLLDWTRVQSVESVRWEDPDSGLLPEPYVPAGVQDSGDQGALSLDPSVA